MGEASRTRREFARLTGVRIPHTPPSSMSPTAPRGTEKDLLKHGYRPWQVAVHESAHAVADLLLGLQLFCVWIDPKDVEGVTGKAESFRPRGGVVKRFPQEWDVTPADLAHPDPLAAEAARCAQRNKVPLDREKQTPTMRRFVLAVMLSSATASVAERLLVTDLTQTEEHLADEDRKVIEESLPPSVFGGDESAWDRDALAFAKGALIRRVRTKLEQPEILAALRAVAERLMARTVLSGDEVREILRTHGLEPGSWTISDEDTLLRDSPGEGEGERTKQ